MSAPIRAHESVIVFDLDDTLYAEFDYKISGIKAVCQQVAELYPQCDKQALLSSLNMQGNSWLDDLCDYCHFNDSEKAALLWQYRLHTPDIRPYMPSEKLKKLIRQLAGSALITDGRSLTQRLKLSALGLADGFEHVLVSEAFASEKPQPERFVFVEEKYPGKTWLYIGDNIKKDFVTPNRRGWRTIGLHAAPHNIHRHEAADFPDEHQPHHWINHLEEIKDLLC